MAKLVKTVRRNPLQAITTFIADASLVPYCIDFLNSATLFNGFIFVSQ